MDYGMIKIDGEWKEMEKITARELKKNFEEHYNHKYKTREEFIRAAEAEYSIEILDEGECIFSGGDMDFIVADWSDFCEWTY